MAYGDICNSEDTEGLAFEALAWRAVRQKKLAAGSTKQVHNQGRCLQGFYRDDLCAIHKAYMLEFYLSIQFILSDPGVLSIKQELLS